MTTKGISSSDSTDFGPCANVDREITLSMYTEPDGNYDIDLREQRELQVGLMKDAQRLGNLLDQRDTLIDKWRELKQDDTDLDINGYSLTTLLGDCKEAKKAISVLVEKKLKEVVAEVKAIESKYDKGACKDV